MKLKYTLVALAATTCISQAATVITAAGITGSHLGDTLAGDGSINTTTNLQGITQTGGATSPATWTHSSAWQDDWQATRLAGATNSKLAWTVIDLGSAQTNLGELLLWNVSEGTVSGTRGTATFNLYFADTPTVAAPGTSGTPTDYDFTSGGWSQLGATRNLATATEDGVNTVDGTFDISSVASARYVGIEILTANGSDAANRVGLAEVVITTVPEPSSTALLGLGGLALILRRRK